jgi:hypothetical protein
MVNNLITFIDMINKEHIYGEYSFRWSYLILTIMFTALVITLSKIIIYLHPEYIEDKEIK